MEAIPFDMAGVPLIPVTHPGRSIEFCLTSFAVPVATKTLTGVVQSVAGGDVQLVPL